MAAAGVDLLWEGGERERRRGRGRREEAWENERFVLGGGGGKYG